MLEEDGGGGEPGIKMMHCFPRDTMLQALRFVIQGAGAKVDAVIRKNIVSLLLSMLGHDEVLLWVGTGLGAPLLPHLLSLVSFFTLCSGTYVILWFTKPSLVVRESGRYYLYW
jgi:hypothetical protein